MGAADALEATVADALDKVNVDGGHEKVKAEAIEAMEAEQERMKAQIDQQQAQERERLERQTAEEQARLLKEEAAAIQKEAEVGAMAKKAELDERVRTAQNKMHGDEARRVQEKATKEFDEYMAEQGKKNDDKKDRLKKRLAAKKAKKALELRRRQETDLKSELEEQRKDRDTLERDLSKEAEAAALEKLLADKSGAASGGEGGEGGGKLAGEDVGQAIELVMAKRHAEETSSLITRQYMQRATGLKEAFRDLADAQQTERSELAAGTCVGVCGCGCV